jgi:3-(3-hydroxy-phenyl)propionate hydroxylase
MMVSTRDRVILEALGASFVCLGGPARSENTLALGCDDRAFAEWADRHRVKGVLVRPDRFIAARLDPSRDLGVLLPFTTALATARRAAAPRAAA